MPEIKPIPTSDVQWATAGTKNDPGAGKRALGWIFQEVPPFDWFNWLDGEQGIWLDWLRQIGSRVFDTIRSALETLSPGDYFRLAPNSILPFDNSPQTPMSTGSSASVLASDGFAVYVFDAVDRELFALNPDTGAILWSTTAANNPQAPVKLHTDGAIVALLFKNDGATNELWAFDAATGASLGSVAMAAATDGFDVVCASEGNGAAGRRIWYTDGTQLRRWDPPGGGPIVEQAIGQVAKAITVNPNWVFVATTPGVGAGAATLRRYARRGTGPTTTSSMATATAREKIALASDGDHVYSIAYGGFGVNAVVERWTGYADGTLNPSPWGGALTGFGGDPGVFITRIDVDDRYVYVKDGVGSQITLDKVSGGVLFIFDVGTPGTFDFTCDGQNLYVSRNGDNILYTYSTERQAGLWVVANPVGGGLYESAGVRRKPFPKRALPISR